MIKAVDADPKPFVWPKSANDILASINRFCLATLKTAEIQAIMGETSDLGQLAFCGEQVSATAS